MGIKLSYGRADARRNDFIPVPVATGVRTEIIETTTMAATLGALTAQAGEDVVFAYADEDTWIQFGTAPTASPATTGTGAAPSTSWFVPAGTPQWFGIVQGMTASAIQA